jgi:hypothetical protein
VPFFFKQWGGVRKKVHGRTFGGKERPELFAAVFFPSFPPFDVAQRLIDLGRIALFPVVSAC